MGPQKINLPRDNQSASGISEEAVDGLGFVDDRPGGQALQKDLSIPAGEKAGIQNGQDAPILAGTDQPSQSLLEQQDRRRNLIIPERLSSACCDPLQPRLQNGLGGRRERETIDDHTTKRLSLDVHPFPEAGRGKKDRMEVFFESLEESRLGPFPLQKAGEGDPLFELPIGFLHVPDAGEEEKSPS